MLFYRVEEFTPCYELPPILIPGAGVEYVDIVDCETFEPVDIVRRRSLVAVCVRLGRTRLIDNTILAG